MKKKMLSLTIAASLALTGSSALAAAADQVTTTSAATPTVISAKDTRISLNEQLSVADAVSLIVSKMELSLDKSKGTRKASDYFNQVSDDADYANDFVIAYQNGLELDRDVDPDAVITREYFAKLVADAIATKGEFAYILIYINVEDQDQITESYQDEIQKLLITKVAALDSEDQFRPQESMLRSKAHTMLLMAQRFVNNTEPIESE